MKSSRKEVLKSQTRAEALVLLGKGQTSSISERKTGEDGEGVIGCLQLFKLSK